MYSISREGEKIIFLIRFVFKLLNRKANNILAVHVSNKKNKLIEINSWKNNSLQHFCENPSTKLSNLI